jgi:hypothetical protein
MTCRVLVGEILRKRLPEDLEMDGKLILFQGRAVAQAVSRLLPTAAARVRVRAACEVCGGHSDI